METGNNRIQKFSAGGVSLGWIGARADGSLTDGWATSGLSGPSSLPGGFISPVSVRLIDGDSLLVTDNANHRIQKFSSDGRFAGWLGGKATGGATAGWEVAGLSAEGSQPGVFSAPFDAVLHGGKLYVADGHNARVQIFELD